MSEFMSVGTLLTFGGAAAATAAITQLLKPIIEKLPFNISNRTITYFTALVILIVSVTITGGGVENYAVCFVNAAVISLSSNGGYDLIKHLSENIREDNDENNT